MDVYFDRVITFSFKGQRLYKVRKVYYNDSMTPMFAIPYAEEKSYQSMDELIRDNPARVVLKDSPILDLDNYLKVYEHGSDIKV